LPDAGFLIVRGLRTGQHPARHNDEEKKRRHIISIDLFLFHRSRRIRRWVCAVSKQEGQSGFLITAYVTGAIKEGERIWPK
jgi:hypothetical protein